MAPGPNSVGARSLRRIAVFSDVHSNSEALEAVLQDVGLHGIDELWCLGDVIGNGHDPDGCFDRVEERCSVVLAGNHEVVISSDRAELPYAAEYSRNALREAGGGRLQRLTSRASEAREETVRLAHGCPSPFDPVRDYLVEDVDPQDVLAACPDDALILVGHTHISGEWTDGKRRLVNVGSVGEPRGGEGLPTWTELAWRDRDCVEVVRHHVEFDIDRYRANMRASGLPLPPMWESPDEPSQHGHTK